MPDDLREELRQSLKSAVDGKHFQPKAFFHDWFRKRSQPQYFLFSKNLKVTNMQVAELQALLRSSIVWRDTRKRVRDFQLLSVHEFYDSVQSLFQSFGADDPQRALEVIPDLYADLIRDIVCIQVFFGSCAVFLPKDMELDLLPMCAESGYIHSCGPSVWNRNTAKATKTEMFAHLQTHLERRGIAQATLIVYAHEDFTRHDRKYAQELKDGLDDVKLHLEKFYIGKESLIQVLKEIKTHPELKDRIKLADPDHYRRSLAIQQPVIWLLVDRKPNPDVRNRGDDQYYILFEQAYKNENAHHLFDENKPAWIDHTTIPHTLVGAMINITRPWWPDGTLVLGDPFVGTGTTWLEGLKFGMTARCGDKEPLVPTLIKDNLAFFSKSPTELHELAGSIYCVTQVRSTLTERDDKSQAAANGLHDIFEDLMSDDDFVERANNDYNKARKTFWSVLSDKHQREINTNDIAATLHERERAFFYLLLRTHRRNYAAIIDRESSRFKEAFSKEAKQLIQQIRTLIEQREQQQGAAPKDHCIVWTGKYSPSCTVAPAYYQQAYEHVDKVVRFTLAEEFTADPERSYDLVITDPPYGLNAEHDAVELGQLYQCILERIIVSLANGGQLVLALPDWSYIGKQVPFFMTKHFITQQVLAIAEKLNREIVQTAHAVPVPALAFRPPYYWESERALRRAVLHFRVRDRAAAPQG